MRAPVFLCTRALCRRVQDMIDCADRDGDGEINMDEFYRLMKKKGANPLYDDFDDDEV